MILVESLMEGLLISIKFYLLYFDVLNFISLSLVFHFYASLPEFEFHYPVTSSNLSSLLSIQRLTQEGGRMLRKWAGEDRKD